MWTIALLFFADTLVVAIVAIVTGRTRLLYLPVSALVAESRLALRRNPIIARARTRGAAFRSHIKMPVFRVTLGTLDLANFRTFVPYLRRPIGAIAGFFSAKPVLLITLA